ncbi:MAG: hypothetical protein IRY99_00775, partial [Isosphaeraceae bacterium]|nr:hypothetical protein [Isosphaeraceae bacterium]
MVQAVLEAEDEVELLRAELALAIFLLGWNYDLSPEAYGTLLDCSPGHPALSAMQRAFHKVALAHARAWQARAIPRALGVPGRTRVGGPQGGSPDRPSTSDPRAPALNPGRRSPEEHLPT